jgi:hypothetical protein
MSDGSGDPQTKALEFINSASTYVLIATIVLAAWVSSGVEFSSGGLRVTSMACLALSAVFGIATLALIPLVQETRRQGQSNFDVEPASFCSGSAVRGSSRSYCRNICCCLPALSSMSSE